MIESAKPTDPPKPVVTYQHIGELAHYVHVTGQHIPAVIVKLGADVVLGQVDLLLMIPDFGTLVCCGIFYSPHLKQFDTWHFRTD